MPLNIPTLFNLRKRSRDDIKAHLPDSDATLSMSNLRAHSDATSAMVYALYKRLSIIADLMMPDTATGEYLTRWLNIFLPEGKRPAAPSRGVIRINGIQGAEIPAGTSFVSGNSDFVTLETVSIGDQSTVDATVVSQQSGVLFNREAGSTLRLVDDISGVEQEAIVIGNGLVGGEDEESDASAQQRMIERIQQPPAGGNKNDYVRWAKEVAGCTRAWSRGTVMGIGTQTTFVMFDELRATNNGIPLQSDLDIVHQYINGVRPVTAKQQYILAPKARFLNLVISDLNDASFSVRAEIEKNLRAMLLFRAEPGRIIRQAWISEAISSAIGEDEHESDAQTIRPEVNEIVVLGTITYA